MSKSDGLYRACGGGGDGGGRGDGGDAAALGALPADDHQFLASLQQLLARRYST